MNLQRLADRVKGILVDPQPEWQKISTEQSSNKELILYYVLPFTAVAAMISFIVVLAGTYLGFVQALRFAVIQLLLPVVSIIVAAVVINELAETFNSVKDLNNAFKLVTYAYTPVLLINIITSISWTLGWLNIFGLYGVYLLWTGLPVMMDTPENKRLIYIIAAVAVVLIINLIIGALFGSNRLGYY